MGLDHFKSQSMVRLVSLMFISLLSCAVYAQDIALSESEIMNTALPGSVEADGDGILGIPSYISITNDSDETMEIGVRRTPLCEVEGSTNQFCWGGNCFLPGTNVSPLTIELDAGETIEIGDLLGFTAYYNYDGNAGLTKIQYEFYDVQNPDNYAELFIVNCIDTSDNCAAAELDCPNSLGVEELTLEPELTAAPNPAFTSTNVRFNLGTSAINANLVLRNALGAEVKTIELDSRFGEKTIDLSGLDAGLYYYSLENNGAVVKTKRLVVN